MLLGIAGALSDCAGVSLVSCRPTVSFPGGPLWIGGEKVKLDNGMAITILPTLNLKIIKNIVWGILIKRVIKKWARLNQDDKKHVLVYNIYTPPISWVYRACSKYGCKLTAILYDLGVPPKRLGLSRLTMVGYKLMEKEARHYIPLLDGRVIINESIIDYYAPGRDYILIDGGINDAVINHLFPLKESTSSSFVFVLAGMLWDQNGTRLVLDCLKGHPDLDVRVVFAGKGVDVPLIEEFATNDDRVEYVGMLTTPGLFRLYEKADVLLNLRLEEEQDFHFPSKLIEYLVTGKHVLSTPVAHAERDYGAYMSILTDLTSNGLAVKMQEIINLGKKSLYEQGVKARDYMLKHRNWVVRTEEIVKYMNSL